MKGYLIFCLDVPLQPCEIGSTFGLRAGYPFRKMFKAGDKKSKSLKVCCPSEMLIASDFFLIMFRNIIFKFGTYGSLSNMTFRNYVTLSY